MSSNNNRGGDRGVRHNNGDRKRNRDRNDKNGRNLNSGGDAFYAARRLITYLRYDFSTSPSGYVPEWIIKAELEISAQELVSLTQDKSRFQSETVGGVDYYRACYKNEFADLNLGPDPNEWEGFRPSKETAQERRATRPNGGTGNRNNRNHRRNNRNNNHNNEEEGGDWNENGENEGGNEEDGTGVGASSSTNSDPRNGSLENFTENRDRNYIQSEQVSADSYLNRSLDTYVKDERNWGETGWINYDNDNKEEWEKNGWVDRGNGGNNGGAAAAGSGGGNDENANLNRWEDNGNQEGGQVIDEGFGAAGAPGNGDGGDGGGAGEGETGEFVNEDVEMGDGDQPDFEN